eukprot:202631-Amphidinium_carterae.1
MPLWPLMPSIDGNAFAFDEPMTTGMATSWLLNLLRLAMTPVSDAQTIGTHSAKATLPSWCAKRGLDMADRRLLGQHRKSKNVSVLTYNRDHLARPLHALGRMLDEIKAGSFDLDASRSGYLAPHG